MAAHPTSELKFQKQENRYDYTAAPQLHRRLKLKILIVVVMDLSFLAVTWFFAPPLTKLVAMSFIIQLTQCTTLETMSSQHLNSDQNRH